MVCAEGQRLCMRPGCVQGRLQVVRPRCAHCALAPSRPFTATSRRAARPAAHSHDPVLQPRPPPPARRRRVSPHDHDLAQTSSPGPLAPPSSPFTAVVGHAGSTGGAGWPSGDVPGPCPAAECPRLCGPPRTGGPATGPQPQPRVQLWGLTARWPSLVQLPGLGRWRGRPLCSRCLRSSLPTAKQQRWAHQHQRQSTATEAAPSAH